jgi:RNA polymerase sigma-70 factor (ECF subfamily)
MTVAFLASSDVPAPASPQGEIDATTLRDAQAGDPQALERFIRHYERTVFAFLSRSIGRTPDVEDLAQEVFVRAYRALPRFEHRRDARISTWLLQIAVHLLMDTRKRKRLPVDPLHEQMVADPGTPETERRYNELIGALERAAGQLPQEQRVVLVLADFHGLDLEQIATVTQTHAATVKTRLFRARAHVKQVLQQGNGE